MQISNISNKNNLVIIPKTQFDNRVSYRGDINSTKDTLVLAQKLKFAENLSDLIISGKEKQNFIATKYNKILGFFIKELDFSYVLNKLEDFKNNKCDKEEIINIINKYCSHNKLLGYKKIISDDYKLSNRNKILRKLYAQRNSNNERRFNDFEISKIYSSIRYDNYEILDNLCTLRNQQKESRFDAFEIMILLNNYSKEQKNLFDDLLYSKKTNGDYRYNAYSIQNLLNVIKPNTKNFFNLISNMKTSDNTERFKAEDISFLMDIYTPKNEKLLMKLLYLKNSKLSIDEIKNLIGYSVENINMAIDNIEKYGIFIKPTFINVFKNDDYSMLNFYNKNELFNSITSQMKNIKDEKKLKLLEKKLNIFKKNMTECLKPIKTSKENQLHFFKTFLVTANNNAYSTILDLDKTIKEYKKTGLPLKYERKDFVTDLKKVLNTLSKEKRENILEKLNINIQKNTYDGIIQINNLDKNNKKEKMIFDLCEKFLLKNEINTGEKNTDQFLNSIIKAIPEFINIIGKTQLSPNQYTVDIHTIKTLKEIVSNPKFNELSCHGKTIIQIMALLHDISKSLDSKEINSKLISSIAAYDILSNINLPNTTKKRIIELIKNNNHLINTNEFNTKNISLKYRNPEDLLISKIFTEADLKSISTNVYLSKQESINNQYKLSEKQIKEFYSTGNFIFPTRILNKNKFLTQKYKGHNYKILNLYNFPDNTDLKRYGLSTDKKSDINFLCHIGDIKTMLELSKPFNESLICTTLNSINNKKTFNNEHLGLLIDHQNLNIATIFPRNQSSGHKKDFFAFVMLCNNEAYNRCYEQYKIIEFLSKKYKIDKNDYGEIYTNIMNKRYLSQIKDITLSNGLTIKSDDIKNAYLTFQDLLSAKMVDNNEITVYNPDIKGVICFDNTIKNIPDDILELIRKHDLPIILFGKNEK